METTEGKAAGSAGFGGSWTETREEVEIRVPGGARLNSSAEPTRNAIRTSDRISIISAERRGKSGGSGAGGAEVACILDWVSGIIAGLAGRASAASVPPSLVSIGAR